MTHPLQKEIGLSVFLSICAGGLFAALYPRSISCSRHFNEGERHSQNPESNRSVTPVFEGHHPLCDAYRSHVFHVNNRGYCGGCSGLATGALAAIIGSVLYAFSKPPPSVNGALFWVGFVLVLVGLVQYRLGIARPSIHFAVNVAFVLGPFFLLMAVTEFSSNLVTLAYLMSTTLFWIITRISLSRLEHDRICGSCKEHSCAYAPRGH